MGENLIITFQEGLPGDVFDELRNRIALGKGRIRKFGADYLFYSILDTIVDKYMGIMEMLREKIERLEGSIIADPSYLVVEEVMEIKKEINSETENKKYKLIKDFFDKVNNDVYPEAPSFAHTNITQQAIKNLIEKNLIKKDSKILDVGCGQGPALDYFKELGYKNLIGVTLSDVDVEVCRSKGYEAYKMDQSFLEFENNSFDVLWVRHCLEHSVMPYYTLNEFNRVLKPQGIIYIEVPAPDTPAHHETNPNHYSVFTASAWASLIKRSGFEIIDAFNYKLGLMNNQGDDFYHSFFCRNIKSQNNEILKSESEKKQNKILHLGLASGENFGWGVCSKYLKKELSKKINIINFDEREDLIKTGKVEGKVFHALKNEDFGSLFNVRGTENFGYTFFESELPELAIKNAKNYDLVLAGSTWNKEKLNSYGIYNTDVLIQGIDPELFYSGEKEKNNDLFVIFSGGKFELRKGQDIVLRAIKILQEKYSDIILINAWYNMWPQSMQTMAASKHINFEIKGNDWKDIITNLCRINGIEENKIFTLPLTPNDKLRDLYLSTDLGLFPNRCEGGTNLVMMEYMACGKPVVASYNSGHTDVLTDENSLPLKKMNDFKIVSDGKLAADWQEPDIDEVISKIEFAYLNRNEIKKIGKKAGEFMKNFTWEKSAETLLKQIGME